MFATEINAFFTVCYYLFIATLTGLLINKFYIDYVSVLSVYTCCRNPVSRK